MSFPDPRRAYDDPDTAHDMARDASACQGKGGPLSARTRLGLGRRLAGQVPAALRSETRQLARSSVSVSDSAVRLADRLLD